MYNFSFVPGCSLLENNTEYQKEKERCIVNKNDISRFSYGGNEYAILTIFMKVPILANGSDIFGKIDCY